MVFTLDSIASDNTWKLYSDFSFLKATVVDDYTVNITTEEPYPGILLRLNYVHIIPKAYTEQVGNEAFAKAPIGTGPYKFAEWSKDEHVILEAYDGYFGGKPSIDKITFNIIPEVASRIAALEAGEVMFSAGIPSVEMERLNALDSINVVAHPASRVTYLSFNHLVDSPIQNLKVRQAICHAVDFDKLINGVLDGYASPWPAWPVRSMTAMMPPSKALTTTLSCPSSCWPRPATPTALQSRPPTASPPLTALM